MSSESDHLFTTTIDGSELIVVAAHNLNELAHNRLDEEADRIVKMFRDSEAKNVIIDFDKTDYFGSTALGFFVKLWKRVIEREGEMVFSGISKHEREILSITKLDTLWPIYDTCDEALNALRAT